MRPYHQLTRPRSNNDIPAWLNVFLSAGILYVVSKIAQNQAMGARSAERIVINNESKNNREDEKINE